MSSTPHTSRIDIDPARRIGTISPLLFGGFAEHMGRCIYEGIYDPNSPLADADGLRRFVCHELERVFDGASSTVEHLPVERDVLGELQDDGRRPVETSWLFHSKRKGLRPREA